MARIIAGVGSSHVPAIGAALDNGKTEEPYWKRVFSGFEKSKEWMAKTKPDVCIVVYNDRQGGYIDNVPSTFTRNEQLDNNTYIGVRPTGGVCPDGGKPNPNTGFCLPAGTPQANNFAIASKDQNPTTIQGARGELLWQINPDWDLLISQSVQNLDAQGLGTQYPVGSDFQPLQPLPLLNHR